MGVGKTVIFAVGFFFAVICGCSFAGEDEVVDQGTMDAWLGWAGNVKQMSGEGKKLNPDLARDPRFQNEEVDVTGGTSSGDDYYEAGERAGNAEYAVPARAGNYTVPEDEPDADILQGD